MDLSHVPPHFSVIQNFVLAGIPFVLALYLFRQDNGRGFLWWLLFPVFILFLPNSAYVLTDIIHFVAAVRDPSYSAALVWLILFPGYLIYISVNFEFYVFSVQWMNRFWQQQGWPLAGWSLLLGIHLLCALGVYLGRVQRLYSHDIVTKPLVVLKDLWLDLTQPHPLLVIIGFAVLFAVFFGLYQRLNRWINAHWDISIRRRAQ